MPSTLIQSVAGEEPRRFRWLAKIGNHYSRTETSNVSWRNKWMNAYAQLAMVRSFTQVKIASCSTGWLSCIPNCWGLVRVLWKVSAGVCFDTDIWCLASWEIVQEQPGSLKSIENVLNVSCPVRFLSLSTVLKFACPCSSVYAPEKGLLLSCICRLKISLTEETNFTYL